jgi:hypothetical protein
MKSGRSNSFMPLPHTRPDHFLPSCTPKIPSASEQGKGMVAPGYTLDPGSVFDEYVSKEGEMTTVALQVLLEELFEVPLSMTETASVRYYTMTFGIIKAISITSWGPCSGKVEVKGKHVANVEGLPPREEGEGKAYVGEGKDAS